MSAASKLYAAAQAALRAGDDPAEVAARTGAAARCAGADADEALGFQALAAWALNGAYEALAARDIEALRLEIGALQELIDRAEGGRSPGFAARLRAERGRAADPDADLVAALETPRAKPTAAMLKRAAVRSVAPEGTVRLDDETPVSVRRLEKAGKLTRDEVRALGRYRADFLYGSQRARMTSRYQPGVDGGGAEGDVAERKLAAWERYRRAGDAMGPRVRAVVEAVMLRDAALGDVERGADYAGRSERSAANTEALCVGAEQLAAFYGGRVRAGLTVRPGEM